MEKFTSLKLQNVETGEETVTTIETDKISPSWKIGDTVDIDINDTGSIPSEIHGTFKIQNAVNMDITLLD